MAKFKWPVFFFFAWNDGHIYISGEQWIPISSADMKWLRSLQLYKIYLVLAQIRQQKKMYYERYS